MDLDFETDQASPAESDFEFDLSPAPTSGETKQSADPTPTYVRVMQEERLLTRAEESALGKTITQAHTDTVMALAPIPLSTACLLELLDEVQAGDRPSTDVFMAPFSVEIDSGATCKSGGKTSTASRGKWKAAGDRLRAALERWETCAAEERETSAQRLKADFENAEPSWVALAYILERCDEARSTLRLRPSADALRNMLGDYPDAFTRRLSEARAAYKRYGRAREQLVRSNLRLAHHQAHQFRDKGVDFDDLVQEALFGLMRAVDRFDFSLGFKFSTYAMTWIRQTITLAIANNSRTVRVPAYVHDRAIKVRRLRGELSQELGRRPTMSELGLRAELNDEQLQLTINATLDAASMDAATDEDDSVSMHSVVPDAQHSSPAASAATSEARTRVRDALEALPHREALIVRMRRGIGVKDPLSLEQIGAQLGISRERARQLEVRAFERLREILDDATPCESSEDERRGR